MDKRKLGRTNEYLSIVGFGGVVVMNETPEDARRFVATAVEERGINYFDVAPAYGNAEERLGPALEPYRKSVFLACKTGKRDAAGAEEELQRSLKLLRTDYLDLYQLHSVDNMGEIETVFAPGGAMETLLKARQNGLTRYLGFSSHHEEVALALIDRFAFDTILFPLNWVMWHQVNLGPRVVARAQEKGMGILAITALAKRAWRKDEAKKWEKMSYKPVDTFEEASLAERFTLSLPITSAVGSGVAELLWWACDIADTFKPLSDEERAQVVLRSAVGEYLFK